MGLPKVLVVEDNLLVLRLSSRMLRYDGLDVVEAENADDAVDIIDDVGAGIAAVFSDILTPGVLDGMDLAHRVHERWPLIPVVLTSGVVFPVAAALPEQTCFVPKPYDLHLVSKLIIDLAGGGARAAR